MITNEYVTQPYKLSKKFNNILKSEHDLSITISRERIIRYWRQLLLWIASFTVNPTLFHWPFKYNFNCITYHLVIFSLREIIDNFLYRFENALFVVLISNFKCRQSIVQPQTVTSSRCVTALWLIVTIHARFSWLLTKNKKINK